MKNEQLNDFQEKFQLFQECVLAWLSELDEDLLRVKASVRSPSSQDLGATNRNEREVNVIPFPAYPRSRIQTEKPVA
jgi:hypothetical protein